MAFLLTFWTKAPYNISAEISKTCQNHHRALFPILFLVALKWSAFQNSSRRLSGGAEHGLPGHGGHHRPSETGMHGCHYRLQGGAAKHAPNPMRVLARVSGAPSWEDELRCCFSSCGVTCLAVSLDPISAAYVC